MLQNCCKKSRTEMTTFAYEVSQYKRRDGLHQITIRMTHNRYVVRKPSNIYASREQISRDGKKLRDAYLIDAVTTYIEKLRQILASIEGSEYYQASDLWNALQQKMKDERGFRLDFIAYTEKQMLTMDVKTAEGYRSSINSLKRFLGKDTVDVNEITYSLLLKYRGWLEKNYGKGCRAASYYLSCFQHIHRMAREEFNDDDLGIVRIPRQPFKAGLIPPQPVTEHRVLSVEQMRSLIRCNPTTIRGKIAKDVFLLSFALVGMNTIDIYYIIESDIKDGVLHYNRRKTDSLRKDNAFIMVRVEPEAQEIMERYIGHKRLLSFADRYADHKNFNGNVNKGLKEVGALIGVPGLNTYYSRHTWGTIARNDCGISFDNVHESLNHAKRGSDRVTDIYVKRDFSRIWEANRKVLDLVYNRKSGGMAAPA